jgi:DNA polymerase III subunit beta
MINMKIVCLKEDLEKAVLKTERVTGKNLTLPVLKGILLDVKKTILLSSTNLDLGVEIETPGNIVEPGRVVVDGSILNNFLSNISKNITLTIEKKDNNLLITGKNIKTNISTLLDDDFPLIPKPKTQNKIKIDSKAFINGLKSVWFSASNSTIKPELASVFIYLDGEKMVFVSTDSFRLAEKKIILKENFNFDSILIPAKNVAEIIKSIEDFNDELEIFLEESQISFKYDKCFITSRLNNGNFPDYKQIIPKEIKTEVIVLKEDIINSLKLTNIFTDKFNQIIFNISPSKNIFTIKSQDQEKGDNISSVESTLDGEDVQISFNYKYVMDSFQSILSDSISFSLSGQGKPMIIKGVSDNSFTYIVMPMNK